MSIQRTLSIIKPDAVAKNVIGQIVARFEQAGLKVIAARLQQLSRADAERFYAVHKERPFFGPGRLHGLGPRVRASAGRRRSHPEEP